jgi:hypothetical protein
MPSTPPAAAGTPDDEFEAVMDEMGIPESKRGNMRQLPLDKRMQMIALHRMQQQQHQTSEEKDGPAKVLSKLTKHVTVDSLRDLRVSLTSNPISWLVAFKNVRVSWCFCIVFHCI